MSKYPLRARAMIEEAKLALLLALAVGHVVRAVPKEGIVGPKGH